MLGQTIDRKYELVSPIGKGGMGVVYEARHTTTGRRVAVKVIATDHAKITDERVSRFQREARAASAIDSQNIVQVLDAGVDPATNTPYLVMEHLEGENLAQLLARLGMLAPEVSLKIIEQACAGIQKAHEARVVHRDIKPANLFLARRQGGEVVVKILDFGIAKIKPEEGAITAELTRSESLIGSPLYMSPEQARGEKVDHRTDLYSLGAVLYCALTGRAPHEGIEALGGLIVALCTTSPPPIQGAAPWVPPEVAAVVHRALELDPADRFQSAGSMLDALRKLLPGGTKLCLSDLAAPDAGERASMARRYTPKSRASRHGSPALSRGAAALAAAAALAFGYVAYKAAAKVTPGSDIAPTQSSSASLKRPEPSTPAPEEPARRVSLVVLPVDVSVEVDGAAAASTNGVVEINGTLGSIHRVRLFKGKQEVIGDVIVAETGAMPPKMELFVVHEPPHPASTSSTPRATSAPATAVGTATTAKSAPPAATASTNPLIPKEWQ